jgi:hypothetical protein
VRFEPGGCHWICGETRLRQTVPSIRSEGQAEGRQEKQFFFEKKNQKTFIRFGQHGCFHVERIAGRNLQKFFASFFQKRRILALPS